MTLRRGFKTDAERIALEVRTEIGLRPTDRLDPLRLAEHLEIPIMGIRDLAQATGQPEIGRHFLSKDRESFSAMTIFYGERRLILHNERHAPTRRASNLAHELAHCLLEHPPGPPLSLEGCRVWNETIEEEATWLGGALLVPRDGAFELARSGMAAPSIAAHFGVSERLCAWRINQTGIAHQVRRLARFRYQV